jgi:hypothetical protein
LIECFENIKGMVKKAVPAKNGLWVFGGILRLCDSLFQMLGQYFCPQRQWVHKSSSVLKVLEF